MSKGARLRAQRAVQTAIVEQEEREVKQLKDLGLSQYDVAQTDGPNRRQRRYKSHFRLRYYRNSDDKFGRPYTAKGVVHRNGRQEFQPAHDPNETNHQRVVRQRSAHNKLVKETV